LLQKRGYTTFAIDGSSGSFYDRAAWYPVVRFQHQQFLKNMPQSPRCASFDSVCDSAIFVDVKNVVTQIKNICILDDFNNTFFFS
jgi:phosphoglycerol transferase MdoB-like AlkP superfamily enzyme